MKIVRNPRIIIPTTEIRRFYSLLDLFNARTTIGISKDINRSKNKKKKFVKIVNNSYEHFTSYKNLEENFIPDRVNRKPLPNGNNNGRYKSTGEVIKALKDANGKIGIDFIEREIDPRRATCSIYDFGGPASHSGTGGIDFIAWKNNKPFIGEVKTRTDKNAFYAFVQVLTYWSELSTPNQIERCNNFKLFGKDLDNQEFSLGIIFADYNHNSKIKNQILTQTKELAKYVIENIKQIYSIDFLNMTKPFTKFEIL